jgi:hypothetical protein
MYLLIEKQIFELIEAPAILVARGEFSNSQYPSKEVFLTACEPPRVVG